MHPPTFAVTDRYLLFQFGACGVSARFMVAYTLSRAASESASPLLSFKQVTCLTGGGICQLFQLVGGQKHDLVHVTVSKRHLGEPKRLSNQSSGSGSDGFDAIWICWT